MFKRFLILLVVISVSFPAMAVNATKAQMRMLDEAEDYLAKLQTLKGRFIQVNPGDGNVSSGEIFISKPGKLKMSYTEPFKIDYYINDNDLTQYDHDLDEVTRGSAPDNPLKVLLYDGVDLINNSLLEVSNITDEGSSFSIYMLTKTDDIREISGLVLRFNKFPIELASVERVDSEGNKTQTNFSSVEINKKVDDSIFKYKKAKPAFPGSRR